MTDSKYCYPGTDVLINKAGVRDQGQLKEFETYRTYLRLAQLENKPIYGSFDLKHLSKIHKFIFQDVYPFAGQIRDVAIFKGSTAFCYPQFINDEAQRIFNGLKAEKFLRGLDGEQFAERAGYYLSEINMLHPFREGNGRTQREFIRTMGLNAGYDIDWTLVDKETNMKGFLDSVNDPSAKSLADVVKTCMSSQEPDKALIKLFQALNPYKAQGHDLER